MHKRRPLITNQRTMSLRQVVVIGLVAACSASPSFYYGGAPIPQYYSGYYPSAVVSPIKSQYHTQNELGQYAYGYNDGYSSKAETKHANGLTEGSYSYVDPNGVLQQYKYESDENGYRVTGTNLPVAPAVPAAPAAAAVVVPASVNAELPQQVQDTPEVAAAKVAHQVAYDEAKKAADASPADDSPSSDDSAVHVVAANVAAPAPSPTAVHAYGYAAYGAYPSYAYAATPYAAAPYAYAPAKVATYAPAPVAAYAAYAPYSVGSYSPVHSQYHAQDEFGQYSYGYNSDSSSKSEVKTADGVTRGGYSYVDANGVVQQYQYVSDPVNGFRVAGTNLPSNSL